MANECNQIIEGYINKGYVKFLEKDPETESKKQCLPHFAVIKADKETTKTIIIFVTSAAQDGTSLNYIIYQGPKLQRDSVHVGIRRYPVAIVGGISEMYLQVKIKKKINHCLDFFGATSMRRSLQSSTNSPEPCLK